MLASTRCDILSSLYNLLREINRLEENNYFDKHACIIDVSKIIMYRTDVL